VMLGPFVDYADAAIQYGFATMFIVAYPLATVLSFVNNYIRTLPPTHTLLADSLRRAPSRCLEVAPAVSPT
jgi:hypothetical protein